MNLAARIGRLENTMGMNRTLADDFELSRPELLTVVGGLMLHDIPAERVDRLRGILNRHEANCRHKRGAFARLSICDVFTAAHDGEEFSDMDSVLTKAGACGL